MTRSISECRLYLCTPDRPDLLEFVEATIRGGVDIVQLRDKFLDAKPLLQRAEQLHALCRRHSIPFILNDRPDLALAVGADGVHVGQDDAPASLARTILGPEAIIGLSTHGPDDLRGAIGQDVAYISAGPVEATPTKPGRPGTGLDYLSQATSESAVPVFVTGGVTPEKIPTLVAAGARHFVVVRCLTEAPDPEAAARSLSDAIDSIVP